SHERNPRQSDYCQRVEITCVARGPVVRAEACASDFYTALDHAIAKLDARLRRVADRRRVHRGRRAPVSVPPAAPRPPPPAAAARGRAGGAPAPPPVPAEPVAAASASLDDDQPWHIVREKEHDAFPMTVDDALYQMELVGHDFFLFLDKESGRPSVVYRRRA